MFSLQSRDTIFWRFVWGFAIICVTIGLLAALPEHTVSIALAYTGACLGGVFLFSRSITGRRIYAHWVRLAMFIVGPISVAWGVVGFTLLFASGQLSASAYHFLDDVQEVFLGMGLGILLLLSLSGGLGKTPRR